MLLAVGICSAAAEGVPYEEELGMSAGEVIEEFSITPERRNVWGHFR
jgi:hypothetical protein